MCPSTHAAPRLHSDWNPSNFQCTPCTPTHPSPHIPATVRRRDWDCIPISAAVQDLPGGGGEIAPSLSEAALTDEVVAAIVDVAVLLALPSPARNQEHIPPVAVPSPLTTTHRAMRRIVFFSCPWASASWLRVLRYGSRVRAERKSASSARQCTE